MITPKTPYSKAIIGLLFFLSGVSALIYQVVWQRGLTLFYGSGTLSTALIVSVFMTGLGFGALLGGYVAERVTQRIKFYFLIELLIGIFGILSLSLLQFIGEATAGADHHIAVIWMGLFLAVPTLLMGMTLPLLVKIYNGIHQDFVDSVSILYFVNTIGGAVGAATAAYLLITFWGLDGALYFAVAVNFILALSILRLARQPQNITKTTGATSTLNKRLIGAYSLVFIMGFLAMGYELLWFRLIGVLVKASPYAFASILTVYLIGLALGSFSMHRLLRRFRPQSPKALLVTLQGGVALSAGVSIALFHQLGDQAPFAEWISTSFNLPLHPMLTGNAETGPLSPLQRWFSIGDIWLWSLWFILMPTLLMGASFPLIAGLAQRGEQREAESVAWVYFFNVLGNTAGGVITGFLLLPSIGSERSLLLFVVVGLLIWLTVGRTTWTTKPIRALSFTATLLLTLFALPGEGQLYLQIHNPEGYQTDDTRSAIDEGRDGIVVTHQRGINLVSHINGLAHGGRPGVLIYPQVNQLLRTAPRLDHILLIGFGTGTTTELLLRSNRVGRITLVELNETLISNLTRWRFFQKMLDNPKLELIIDDGRRHLFRSDVQYDAIIMDPLRSTTAFSNNIYSADFYRLASQRLHPRHGILLLWADEINTTLATVNSVFPAMQAFRLLEDQEFIFLLAGQDQTLLPQGVALDSINAPIFTADEQSAQNYYRNTTHPIPIVKQKDVLVNEDLRPINEYYLRREFKRLLQRGAKLDSNQN